MINWRLIPHPTYGNFGGAYNTSHKRINPIDWMDKVFKDHDISLKKNKNNKENRKKADLEMLNKLKEGCPTKLYYKLYGRLYRLGTIMIFSIILSF